VFRFLAEVRDFLFCNALRSGLGYINPRVRSVAGAVSPEMKRLESETES
jgi:hypothetical protein